MLDAARAQAIGQKARQRVVQDFSWQQSFAQLDALLERADCDPSRPTVPIRNEREHCAVIQS